mgnify:CR=1 FL=1
MKRFWDFFWPAVGLGAVIWSVRLLYLKLEAEAATDGAIRKLLDEGDLWSDIQVIASVISQKLHAISPQAHFLSLLSTLVAYGALAWYDRIALIYLKREQNISWLYISMCSFVTYALSHNIGASVFSGGMVRYRAYSAKNLTPAEIAALVALCSFTFAFGTMMMLGLVLVFEPQILEPLKSWSPLFAMSETLARGSGALLLLLCMIYTIGAWKGFKPVKIGGFELFYPGMNVVLRQYLAAPLELIGAAGIIYFALPAEGNPGYAIVLGAFLLSFSAGLLSQVPGGVGVMEAVFLAIMPGLPASSVFAALLVWRMLYLIMPLVFALPVILLFERSQLGQLTRHLRDPKDEAASH